MKRVKVWNVSVYHPPRSSELQSKKQYLVLLDEKGPRILNGNLDHGNKLVSCGFHVSSSILQTAFHLLVMGSGIRICGIPIPPSVLQASVDGGRRPALQENQTGLSWVPAAGTSAMAMAGTWGAAGLLSAAAVTQVRDENNHPTLVNIKQKLISI